MAVHHVRGASTAIMRSSRAHSSLNAVSSMGNALVHLASVAMTVRSPSAARWQMARDDRHEKGQPAIVKKAGKGSTATSAPPIKHAMS